MITIVTEWFDLNRGSWEGVKNNRQIPSFIKRTREDYFLYFENLCKIRNPIIIYTEPKLINTFQEIGRRNDTDLTVIPFDFFNSFSEERAKIRKIMDSDEFINFVADPSLPEYWNENYILVNFIKPYLVKKSYDDGLILSSNISAWIDFGYVRDLDRFPVSENFIWRYDGFGDNKMHLFQIQNIHQNLNILDVIKYNQVFFQGCHAAGNGFSWDKYQKMMDLSLTELLENKLVDDDQTLMLMSYLKYPSLFNNHFIDTSKDGWFVIFKEFFQ